jgi:hypothetical protein
MESLPEEEFIHEGYRQDPWSFWGWLLAVVAVSVFFWASLDWYSMALQRQYAHSPFLQVTNRQMSLFLWQNPSYMRIHTATKNGYLPAFEYVDKIGLKPEYADEIVIAPPELLFLYHTWHRLISSEFPRRAIPAEEFHRFLYEVEEWQPRFWPEAPKPYVSLFTKLSTLGNQNLNLLSEVELPLEVRQAFIGWKNYFTEGEQIATFAPTWQQLSDFLHSYPHYSRNYWCEIVGPQYLKNGGSLPHERLEVIPPDELSPFLRIALYNAHAS